MELVDRYRGCLIGGAAGDALGYPVEFMDINSIIAKYGKQGITSYELKNGIAEISDDTQMTLFTATGLLLWITRRNLRGFAADPWYYVQYSYKDWYRTQTEDYPLKGSPYSWLDDIPELFSRRAPGNTCLSALSSDKIGTIEEPINNSKGCGGVMRVAPVGLYLGREHQIEETDHAGAGIAALTHGHSLGYIPAVALTHIIARITHYRYTIEEAAIDMCFAMKKQFHEDSNIACFLSQIQKAMKLARDESTTDIEAISMLGEGWVAEEALAIALFCAIRYSNDFKKAIVAAVNHSGDSDSTGSITGNIVGAYIGLQGIPDEYTENLELKDIIIEVADDLYHDCKISEYGTESDPEWEQKYCWNRSIHKYLFEETYSHVLQEESKTGKGH